MERPDFDSFKTYEEFIKYYWYREELIKICKAHGLKADGGAVGCGQGFRQKEGVFPGTV